MVAFLLVYSTDVEIVQNSKGVEIPQSTAEVQPKHSVVVMITKDQLFVQGELVTNVGEIRDAKGPLIEPLRAVLGRPMLAGAVESFQLQVTSWQPQQLKTPSQPRMPLLLKIPRRQKIP